MPIYLGEDRIKNLYIGSTRIKEAYLGSTPIYKSELYVMKDGVLADGFTETAQHTDNSRFPRCAADSGYWGYYRVSGESGTLGNHYRAAKYIEVDFTGYTNLHITCEYDSTKTDTNGNIKGDAALICTKVAHTVPQDSSVRVNNLTTNADTISWIGGLNGSSAAERTYDFNTDVAQIKFLQLAVYAYNKTKGGFKFRIKDIWVD